MYVVCSAPFHWLKQVSSVSFWTGTINTPSVNQWPLYRGRQCQLNWKSCYLLFFKYHHSFRFCFNWCDSGLFPSTSSAAEPIGAVLVFAYIFNLSTSRCHDQLKGFCWSRWTDLVKTERLIGTGQDRGTQGKVEWKPLREATVVSLLSQVLFSWQTSLWSDLKTDAIGGRSQTMAE